MTKRILCTLSLLLMTSSMTSAKEITVFNLYSPSTQHFYDKKGKPIPPSATSKRMMNRKKIEEIWTRIDSAKLFNANSRTTIIFPQFPAKRVRPTKLRNPNPVSLESASKLFWKKKDTSQLREVQPYFKIREGVRYD